MTAVTAMPTSREIANAAIRERLSEVALDVVLRQGFDNVTLPDLAAAAGVSRSTFLRYLGSKEEAVLSGLVSTGDHLAEHLDARPPTEDDWVALRRAIDYICDAQSSDPAGALALARLIHANPSLGATHSQHQNSWRDGLIAILQKRSPQRTRVATIALAEAALGCLDAATIVWIESEGSVAFDQAVDEAFSTITPR